MEIVNVFENLMTYQFILIAALCGVVAFIIKQIPKVPNWLIPIIILIIGIFAMMAWMGFTVEFLILGALASALECYIYELFTSTMSGIFKQKKVETTDQS